MPEKEMNYIKAFFKKKRVTYSDISKLSPSFSKLDSGETAKILVYAGKNLGPEALGYFVFPLIKNNLSRDTSLFKETAGILTNPETSDVLFSVSLDFLTNLSAEKKQLQSHLVEVVQKTASIASISKRSKAIRYLAEYPNQKTFNAMHEALDTATPVLVDAVATAVSEWQYNKVRYDIKIVDKILNFAAHNIKVALTLGGLLRNLALYPKGHNVLSDLRKNISNSKERDLFLSAVGGYAKPKVYADLIVDVIDNPSEIGEQTVRAIVFTHQKLPNTLYKARLFDPLFALVRIAPDLVVRDPEFTKIARLLLNNRDAVLRQKARGVYYSIGWKEFDFIDPRITSIPTASNPEVVSGGYATDFQIGDAIYKSLDIHTFGDHWHAGLFCGFKAISGTGFCWMYGRHVSSMGYFRDSIEDFNVTRSLINPSTNLRDILIIMKREFIEAFGCTSSAPFKGARSAPNVSSHLRHRIIDTSETIKNEKPLYTWANMLRFKGLSWDGTPRDISSLRCDGLVEYCYESQGVRVCGGEDSSKWNISSAYNSHPKNHNNFHGYSGCTMNNYNHGDLCPKIQAGHLADDTTFVTPSSELPELRDFNVADKFGNTRACKYITFKVRASSSYYFYIRLLVRKKTTPTWYFLKSEDPLGIGENEGGFLYGTWSMKRISGYSHYCWWMGKTVRRARGLLIPEVAGPNFKGQAGVYEFRIQCIDEGGNLSDEWAYSLNLTWD